MVSSWNVSITGALALTLTLTLTLLAVGGVASGAWAQGVYYERRPVYVYEPEPLIPPRAVAYRLMDRGFGEIGRPRFDGRAYVVDATNPAGDRVRLHVDARDGAVIGRERLGEAYFPTVRPGRSAAGYGWTEEDGPRRSRDGERLVPPADIPDAAPSRGRPQARAELQPPIAFRPGATDANPIGLNPDARGRPDAAARRAAKPAPAKAAAPRIAPVAPQPRLVPSEEAAKPEPSAKPAEPVTAAVEPPKVIEPKLVDSKPVDPGMTPASFQPPANKAAEAPSAKPGWQDPPAGDAKKNVRVIGGATVVPGAGEAPAANPN